MGNLNQFTRNNSFKNMNKDKIKEKKFQFLKMKHHLESTRWEKSVFFCVKLMQVGHNSIFKYVPLTFLQKILQRTQTYYSSQFYILRLWCICIMFIPKYYYFFLLYFFNSISIVKQHNLIVVYILVLFVSSFTFCFTITRKWNLYDFCVPIFM